MSCPDVVHEMTGVAHELDRIWPGVGYEFSMKWPRVGHELAMSWL